MTYGASPDHHPEVSGFVNGDDATSLTTPADLFDDATSSSPVGTIDFVLGRGRPELPFNYGPVPWSSAPPRW